MVAVLRAVFSVSVTVARFAVMVTFVVSLALIRCAWDIVTGVARGGPKPRRRARRRGRTRRGTRA